MFELDEVDSERCLLGTLLARLGVAVSLLSS